MCLLCLRTCVHRVPRSIHQAHYSLGLVYASLKDKDGFTREFAILKKLDPKLAEQLYNAVKQ
jgi:hypothetical protein